VEHAHEAWDLDAVPPPQLAVVDAVSITARALWRRLDREVGAAGLTWAQGRVVLELSRDDGWLHAGGIARDLGLTRQAVHQSLRRLDQGGSLRWRDDGWIKSVRLTTKGRALARDVEDHATGTFDAIWGAPAPDLNALVRGCASLRRELRREAPEPGWWFE
jgi:DNA-binding MarR family transcriptional regulator